MRTSNNLGEIQVNAPDSHNQKVIGLNPTPATKLKLRKQAKRAALIMIKPALYYQNFVV